MAIVAILYLNFIDSIAYKKKTFKNNFLNKNILTVQSSGHNSIFIQIVYAKKQAICMLTNKQQLLPDLI